MAMKITDKPLKALLSEWDDAAGKTLESVSEETADWDDYLVFRFTDGTAILLDKISDEWRDSFRGEPQTLEDGYGLSEEKKRVYFGLASLEEYERKVAREEQRKRDEQHDAERMQYERLKRKFG